MQRRDMEEAERRGPAHKASQKALPGGPSREEVQPVTKGPETSEGLHIHWALFPVQLKTSILP